MILLTQFLNWTHDLTKHNKEIHFFCFRCIEGQDNSSNRCIFTEKISFIRFFGESPTIHLFRFRYFHARANTSKPTFKLNCGRLIIVVWWQYGKFKHSEVFLSNIFQTLHGGCFLKWTLKQTNLGRLVTNLSHNLCKHWFLFKDLPNIAEVFKFGEDGGRDK